MFERLLSSSLPQRSLVRVILRACLSRHARHFFTLILANSLFACEAPLNLDGVNQEIEKPVLRFDQFHASAKNSNSIVVVGEQGLVVVSNDNAKQWQRKQITNDAQLIDLASCPNDTFVALDYKRRIWISEDDGNTWIDKEITSQETPQAISCDPNNAIWVVGSFSSILSSHDSGNTWKETSLDEDLIFTTIQFIDGKNVIVTGEFGAVISSSDGGNTWERQPSMPYEFYPHATFFKDKDTGWVAGLNGVVLHTTDTGKTWRKQNSATKKPLFGLLENNGVIYTVGDNGILLMLQGDNWVNVKHDKLVFSYLRSMLPLNDRELLLVGGAGALFTVTIPNTINTSNVN